MISKYEVRQAHTPATIDLIEADCQEQALRNYMAKRNSMTFQNGEIFLVRQLFGRGRGLGSVVVFRVCVPVSIEKI